MSRRRFFKSFFYINYGGTAHGETVIVSPFVAGGASDTIELVSGKPWVITNGLTWLTVSSLSNKSGTYTITLTASQNTEHSQRTGSFTAKTLDDKYSIVVSVSQEAAPSEKYIRIDPTGVTMDAVDNYNALKCYFSYNGSETEVTPTWSSNNTAVTISSYGVLASNNTTPNPLTVTITATYVHEGDTLTATATVNVAAAEIERYITVSPAGPIMLSATGSQQLDVIYHEIINGVATTRNVTTASTYSSPNTAITVNSTGLITANNTGTTTETANITISYSDVTPITVSVQASPANVEYRNLRTVPTTMTLDSGDTPSGVEVQALVDIYVNGTKTGEENVTHANGITWSSEHTEIATVGWNGTGETIVPNYDPAHYYPSNRYVNVVANYLMSAATCEVTVLPEGRKEYSIEVIPASTAINSTGEVQLAVSFITKTDGSVTGTEVVTTESTYSTQSQLISVTSGGKVTGQGSAIGGTANVNVTYTRGGVTYNGTSVIVVYGTSTEYKNLSVSPATMTLNSGDSITGKAISATVEKWIDGAYDSTVDVTQEIANGNGWSSSVNTAATVEWSSTQEIVKPVYSRPGYYPNNRTATITASYLNSAATCTVTVEPEGLKESSLVVSPTTATIAYNGTTALTVTYYEYLDGVQQTASNVTTAATYDKGGSTYLNVNRGSITGTNQTNTAQTVPITVSYASQDYPMAYATTTITVQGKPNYTYALEVTPATTSISYSGTVQLTVILVVYADGHEESRTDVTRGYGTNYSVTAGNTYISVNNNGLVTGINSSTTAGTGEVTASFNVSGYGTIYGYSSIQVGAAPAKFLKWWDGTTASTHNNASSGGSSQGGWTWSVDTNYIDNELIGLTTATTQTWLRGGIVRTTGAIYYVDANPTGSLARSGSISWYSGSTEVLKLTVNQQAGPISYYFQWSGGTDTATTQSVTNTGTVLSNTWTSNYTNLTFTTSDSWLSTASTASTNFQVQVSAQATGAAARTGYVYAKNGGTTVGTWTISQQAGPAPSYYFQWSGGTNTATTQSVTNTGITLSNTWTSNYTPLTFTTSESWLTVSNTASTGFRVTVSAQATGAAARTGYVYAKNGTTTVGTWTISQQAGPAPSYYFRWGNGSTTATSATTSASTILNGAWSSNYTDLHFTASNSWLTINNTGSSSVGVSVAGQSEGAAARTGYIYAYTGSSTSNIVGTWTINQDAGHKPTYVVTVVNNLSPQIHVTYTWENPPSEVYIPGDTDGGDTDTGWIFRDETFPLKLTRIDGVLDSPIYSSIKIVGSGSASGTIICTKQSDNTYLWTSGYISISAGNCTLTYSSN